MSPVCCESPQHTAEEAETVAEDSIALMELVEKYTDADLFLELGQWTLQKLMEAEVEAKFGAGRHE